MTHRTRDLVFIAGAAIAAIGGVIWLSLLANQDSFADLTKPRALARDQRFAEAQNDLEKHLRAHPKDVQARILIAEVATDRPDPAPELALEHLRQIRPTHNGMAALVAFLKGKAEYQRGNFDLSETAWNEALRLDPTVPEAGSALLDLLEREGRLEEAYVLGNRLFEVEPNLRDRVRLLIELARLDVERPDPDPLSLLLEPLARKHPDSLPLAGSYGLALIHSSQSEQGVATLRAMLDKHPDAPEAWDLWLTGLDEAKRPEDLIRELERLPKAMAADPRFIKFTGMAAQAKQDWAGAVKAYQLAFDLYPFDEVLLYRLSRAHRPLGASADRDRVDRLLKVYQDAENSLRALVESAMKTPDLGRKPHPEIYTQFADLREQMGRPAEARAWHQLVLLDIPNHAPSLAALKRLESEGARRQ